MFIEDKFNIEDLLNKAEKDLEDVGHFSRALAALEELIKYNSPKAWFLFSTIVDIDETIQEYDTRSIRYLTKAASYNYAPAQYLLGMRFLLGDGLKIDKGKAALLFKESALGGYPLGWNEYGHCLYFGLYGIEKDIALGLDYIQRAASTGVEVAILALEDLACDLSGNYQI